MFKHPMLSPLYTFLLRLMQGATIAMSVFEYDGATSNDRLYHHLQNKSSANQRLDASFTCRNHRHNLIITHSAALICVQVTLDLYSLAVFLALGAHHMRLVAVTRRYITVNLVILEYPPSLEDQAFADELKGFLLLNWKRERRAHRTDGNPQARQSQRQYKERLDYYFACRNAGYGKTGIENDGKIFHACEGKHCPLAGPWDQSPKGLPKVIHTNRSWKNRKVKTSRQLCLI
jgi:hypothetical protein